MPQVQMPDGTVVEMPDKLSPEDAVKFKALMQRAPAKPAEEAPWYQGALDTVKNISTAAYKGVAGLAAGAADAFAAQPDFADAIAAKAAGRQIRPTGDTSMPVSRALEATGYQPKTKGEQWTNAITRGATGAVLTPGAAITAPVRSMVIGGSAAAGSEAAANAFGQANIMARLLGGLAGGVSGGVLTSLKTNAPSMAKGALRGVSEEDLARAKANMETAQAAGMPINLSQAMERPSNIDNVVDALAGNQYGNKVQAQLRAQPIQANMGMETEMANLPGTVRTPQTAANNMQNVTTAAIDKARQARTAAWEAKRKAVEQQTFGAAQAPAVSPSAVEGVGYQLGLMAEARPNTAVGEQLRTLQSKLFDASGAPLTDPKQLNEVLKEAATKLKSPDLATKGIDAGQSKFLAQTINDIRDDLGPAFKPIREANLTYKQITDEVINPLKKSVVGRMAGRRGEVPDAEAVRGKITQLFEQGTTPGAKSSDILRLEKELRGIKSGEAGAALDGSAAFQDAAKSWIAEKISDAVRPVGGRLNEDLPKRLTQAFAGDENRSQGMRDTLVGLARSQGMKDDALYPGMEKFLKVVGMASRRPAGAGAGARELDEIAGQSAVGGIGRFSAITPLRQPILKWTDYLKADAYRAMDDLLTSPQGVDMLKKLAAGSPADPKVQAAMATFLGTNANMPQGQQQK